MIQTLGITDYINSLAEAETQFGRSRNDDPRFFTEWVDTCPI